MIRPIPFPSPVYRLHGVALPLVVTVVNEYGHIRMTMLPGSPRSVTYDMDLTDCAYIADALRDALPMTPVGLVLGEDTNSTGLPAVTR